MSDPTEHATISDTVRRMEQELSALKSALAHSREREQQQQRFIESLTVAQKRADEALRENRERVALAQQAGGVGFFDWDIAADESVWSPQLESIFGLPPGEGRSERWPQLVHPDDLPAVTDRNARCFHEKCPDIHGDFRIVRPSGEMRWVEGHGVIFYDPAGTPLRMIGAFVDITERKRAEEVLRESEARSRREAAELDLVYRTAPVGLCVLDDELRYARVNERLAEMNGIPASAHLGKTFREVVPDVAAEAEPMLRRVLETGEPVVGFELQGRSAVSPELRRYWTSQYWPLKDGDGKVFGVNVVVEDITERKRLEETCRREREFRTLAENSTDVIVRVDKTLRRIYANPAIEVILERPREAILGKTNSELGLPPEVAEMWDEHLRRAFATGKERIMEFWLPTSTGKRYLHSRLVPERNAQGEVETLLGITRDLTRNKLVEEALRESERRYRELVENLYEGIWLVDEKDTTTFVNGRLTEMLGYDASAMIGRPLSAFMSAEAAEVAQRNLARGRTGVRADYEFEFRRKDGTPIMTRIATAPVFDDAGRYKGALAGVIDITERLRAERALQESEARFRHVVELVPDILYRAELPGFEPTFVSPALTDVLGFTPEEWISSRGLWMQQLHEEDRERVLAEATTAPDRHTLRYRMWRKDGSSFRWVEDRAHIERNSSGRPVAVFGVVMDITDRIRAEEAVRRREQEFRALAERSPDVVTRVDRNLRSLYVNPAIKHATGFPAAYFAGKDIRLLDLPEEAKTKWIENTQAVFDTAEERAFEFAHRADDGKQHIFYTRAVPEFGQDGRVETVMSVTRDITKLREAEDKIRRTVDELEAANRLLEAQSRTDSLTGLANRRHLFAYIDKEWRRETRYGRPISMIMADIDFFKAYNDHYGHLAGDECLRRVADALRSQVRRPGDLLARYGGEEFVVVLPETPLSGARELAETMRKAVEDIRLPHDASSVAPYVTVSLGVAELSPAWHKSDNLFMLADAALYRAKESGRNRVGLLT